MQSHSNLILNRLQVVMLTSVLLAFLGSAPAFAEDFFAGQPYFSLSGMAVEADSATITSADGTSNPAFDFPDPTLKTEIGFGVVGALGWLTDTNWRLEIELGHRQVALEKIGSPLNTLLDGDLYISTAFVNIIRDFRGESFTTPYFGIGVGGAYHKLDVGSIGGASPDFGIRDGFSLAYQAMVGLNFEVGDDMDIFTGYRFMGAWEPDYEAFELDRLDTHNIEVGVKFYVENWFN